MRARTCVRACVCVCASMRAFATPIHKSRYTIYSLRHTIISTLYTHSQLVTLYKHTICAVYVAKLLLVMIYIYTITLQNLTYVMRLIIIISYFGMVSGHCASRCRLLRPHSPPPKHGHTTASGRASRYGACA